MEYWEQAQNIVAKNVLGKVTPGSGNGRVKGDIVKEGIVIEVKQTCKESYSLSRKTLNKLMVQAKKNRSIFVVVFQLRPYAYLLEPSSEEYNDWKSMTLTENNLPSEIYTSVETRWRLVTWEEIRNL